MVEIPLTYFFLIMDIEKNNQLKAIEDKLEEVYNSLMEKPLRVLGIFNDFFGEERVDMQGYLSLDNFKAWMNIEPISRYVPTSSIAGMEVEDWKLYQSWTITDLPRNQVYRIIEALNTPSVRDNIGNNKFVNGFILVHFPHVKVTNENDRSVDINHLWARVRISYNGSMNGGFTLNRSEYTMLHLISGYMHSHISHIPTSDFTNFMSPCTGSGPINSTISSLNREFDEDIWNMFCLELSKYVTVESIAGRPYNYLEKLGANIMSVGCDALYTYNSPYYVSSALSHFKLKEFVKHFINSKKLKFNYVNHSYSIGMSLIEYMVLISNEFIAWYNDQYNKGEVYAKLARLKEACIIRECIISNGKIYYDNNFNDIERYREYIGKKVCVFKGKEITINITDLAKMEENDNKTIIMEPRTALFILNMILKVLNYRYGRNNSTNEDNQSRTEVRYL